MVNDCEEIKFASDSESENRSHIPQIAVNGNSNDI